MPLVEQRGIYRYVLRITQSGTKQVRDPEGVVELRDLRGKNNWKYREV